MKTVPLKNSNEVAGAIQKPTSSNGSTSDLIDKQHEHESENQRITYLRMDVSAPMRVFVVFSVFFFWCFIIRMRLNHCFSFPSFYSFFCFRRAWCRPHCSSYSGKSCVKLWSSTKTHASFRTASFGMIRGKLSSLSLAFSRICFASAGFTIAPTGETTGCSWWWWCSPPE